MAIHESGEIPVFDLTIIGKRNIEALIRLRLQIESADHFGEWVYPKNSGPGAMPCCSLSELVHDFVDTCYQNNFVQQFDWNFWAMQNEDLANNGTGIEDLDLDGIVKLTTSWIRGDRFCEGLLLNCFDEGLIERLLKRLESYS